MPKILIVEDDSDVSDLIKHSLSIRDYSTLRTESGQEAISLAISESPDMIILDLKLPDIDGIEVCEILKKNPKTKDVPILMLTARVNVIDKVKGLENGADDYLTKPFDPMELIARTKVLLRRTQNGADAARTPIKVGQIRIDPVNYSLEINNEKNDTLTPKEFDILYVLMRKAPLTVSRDEIYKTIWGKTKKSSTRVIDIHVAKTRKKIGGHFIKTIPAKGYLFSAT